MYRKAIFLTAALIFILYSCSFAALFDSDGAYIQTTFEGGEINWATMTVRAKGNSDAFFEGHAEKAAGLSMQEAAIQDAYYNILETLRSVPISSSFHIDDEIYIYPESNDKIMDIVFKAQVISAPEQNKEGIYEATVELRMTDKVFQTIYPKRVNLPDGENIVFQGRGIYTSIIFDATMTDFSPVLMPQVQDSNDKPYYNLDKKNRPVAAKRGLARYFKSLEAAKNSSFAGRKPYVISKTKMDKYKEDTLIVQFPVLDKARNDAIVSEVLGKCKVIIIVK